MPPDSGSRGAGSAATRFNRLLRRLLAGVQDRQVRRTAFALIGVGAGIIPLLRGSAHGAQAKAVTDGADTLLLSVGSALGVLIAPGLAVFHGGFSRAIVLGTMLKSFLLMGVFAVLWVAIGYSLGCDNGFRSPYIGGLGSMWQNGIGGPYGDPPLADGFKLSASSFALFQGIFAILTPALISSALVGAASLGLHASLPDNKCPPHNIPFILLGAGLLSFGWFGFNGASMVTARTAGYPFTTTSSAAFAGVLTCCLIEWSKHGKLTTVSASICAVPCLVGITPAAGSVHMSQSIPNAALAVAGCSGAMGTQSEIQFDDSHVTFLVHGVGGTSGAQLTGIQDGSDPVPAEYFPRAATMLEQRGIACLLFTQFKAVMVSHASPTLSCPWRPTSFSSPSLA